MVLENLTLAELDELTPEQLSHIKSNAHKVSSNIVQKAIDLIPLKVEERRNQIREKLEQINNLVVGSGHFEIDVCQLSGFNLTLGGSHFSTHLGHDLELTFEMVFHYSGTFWSYNIDTDNIFIRLATEEEQRQFNSNFNLIHFAQTFIIDIEDDNPIYISAENFSFETDKSKMIKN